MENVMRLLEAPFRLSNLRQFSEGWITSGNTDESSKTYFISSTGEIDYACEGHIGGFEDCAIYDPKKDLWTHVTPDKKLLVGENCYRENWRKKHEKNAEKSYKSKRFDHGHANEHYRYETIILERTELIAKYLGIEKEQVGILFMDKQTGKMEFIRIPSHLITCQNDVPGTFVVHASHDEYNFIIWQHNKQKYVVIDNPFH